MITRFMDMHSGGGAKLDWEIILIEAPETEARAVFYNRFKRNPDTCCGNDYSVDEEPTLAQATAYDRNCAYDKDGWIEKPRRESSPLVSVDDYLKRDDVLFIPASEIADHERKANIPEEGYVWR